jgi:AAA15 family ATPase/GTPase
MSTAVLEVTEPVTTAQKLCLESLEIKNFRAFEELRIERLGRVNLFIGENNVGKSSLLEALWLLAHEGHPVVIAQILEHRDEAASSVIYKQLNGDEGVSRLNLQKILNDNALSEGDPDFLSLEIGDMLPSTNKITMSFLMATSLQVEVENNLNGVYRSDRSAYPLKHPLVDTTWPDPMFPCTIITANSSTLNKIEQLWDNIVLTPEEDDVLNALRLITPSIQKINWVNMSNAENHRIPMVVLNGKSERIPLRRLGEGMNRLFGLILALVNAKNGVCLLDEIENGLHFSIQPQVWHLIFEVARRLNVQVFATTHSWDCLTAFQEAASENEDEEGLVIRLVNKNGRIRVTFFDEKGMKVIVREGMEIR